MNLEAYQKFIKIFGWINSQHSEIEDLPMQSIMQKLRYFDLLGLKNDEDKAEAFKYRKLMMKTYIHAGLQTAKFFEIDKIEKRLLLLTDCPKNNKLLKQVKLPYPAIFLDIEINETELSEKLLNERNKTYKLTEQGELKKISGILIMEIKETEGGNYIISSQAENKITGRIFYIAYCVQHEKEGQDYVSIYDLIIPIEQYENSDKITYIDKKRADKEMKFFRNFIINFCLFITHPEIELIHINRSNKNAQRRMKNNKIPLPDSMRIKLKGKIKRYIDNFKTELEGAGFNHRFWVRGHWREHKSDRYKEAKGKIIWISPFIKGRGELIEKTYLLEANEEDKKEYDKEFLFFDDIKPLNEPLRKKREKGTI